MRRTILPILISFSLSFLTLIVVAQSNNSNSSSIKYIDADIFSTFDHGVALVTKGGSFGLIDTSGNFIIPYNKYKMIGSKQGFISATTIKNQHILMNAKGKIIYTGPGVYYYFDDLTIIRDGYLMVSLSPMIWVNLEGDKFYQPSYNEYTSQTKYSSDWSEGLSIVSKFDNGLKYGFYDHSGKIIIKPEYDYAEPFSEGLAVVGKKNEFQEMKYGFVDKNGKLAIPLMYSIKPSKFGSGLADIKPLEKKEFLFAYINKQNDIILKFDRNFLTKLFGKYYVSEDMNGNAFKDGFAELGKGFIDSTGKFFTVEEIELIKEPLKNRFPGIGRPDQTSKVSLLTAQINGHSVYQYINENGIVVIQTTPKTGF